MAEVKPYDKEGSKKEQVRDMFDAIAPKYDLLNHVLSMNIDRGWRRKLVKMVAGQNPDTILDLATGTADLAISIKEKVEGAKVIGADLSPEMVEVGREKVLAKGLDIELQIADAEKLPYADETFGAVTIAFGVRNFENLPAGLRQMRRVLKDGGRIYVLEFSKPKQPVFAALYRFYSRFVLPVIGRMVSKDRRAYSYLPESIMNFACGEEFVSLLREAGFKNASYRTLTMGIATIYTAEK